MKTDNGFEIKYVFLAYVPPYKNNAPNFILETEVIKKSNKTTEYLFKIFDSALDEAKIEIIFNADEKQNNIIRKQIVSLAQKDIIGQKTPHAKNLAHYLYEETDGRNGKGLFAIIEGEKEKKTRLILIRFKGDEGLVNHGKKKVLVDYISEVFTKKSNHYKLAVYEDIISEKCFWKGFSVDKQITGNQFKSISYFWVESFLRSTPALTAAQGTLQFSKILKSLLSKTQNIEEQEEIISGIVNIKNKKNIQMSIADFCSTYLNPKLATRIKEETNNDKFFNSVFTVDDAVYKKEFGKTVVNIQGGITAFVPTFKYDKHVKETINEDGSKNITIEGKLASKKINVQSNTKEIKNDKPEIRN